MKTMTWFALLQMIAFGTASFVCAQEEATEFAEEESAVQVEMAVIDGDGLGGPMVFSTTTETFGDGTPPKFQFLSGEAATGMAFMGGPLMSAPDPMSLLNDASVQKDLELVDDQVGQLREMQNEFAREMKEQIGDFSKGEINPDRFKNVGELVKRIREQQKSRMEQMLLPHQLERLKQVALQKHMEAAGTAGALGGKIAEELGITDEQKVQLKEKEKEVKQDMAEKMAKLREDARKNCWRCLRHPKGKN